MEFLTLSEFLDANSLEHKLQAQIKAALDAADMMNEAVDKIFSCTPNDSIPNEINDFLLNLVSLVNSLPASKYIGSWEGFNEETNKKTITLITHFINKVKNICSNKNIIAFTFNKTNIKTLTPKILYRVPKYRGFSNRYYLFIFWKFDRNKQINPFVIFLGNWNKSTSLGLYNDYFRKDVFSFPSDHEGFIIPITQELYTKYVSIIDKINC